MIRACREATTDKELTPKTTRTTPQSGDMINTQTNNTNNPDTNNREVNVERVNDSGIGDAGANDEKVTHYTSNHSGDA